MTKANVANVLLALVSKVQLRIDRRLALEQISLGSNREDSQRFNNERVCRH
jgi:hypothetical protein